MNTAKIQDHSTRAHALLSASGASRWLNCTPSARLEDRFGEKTTSPFAKEGTLAHELAELYIKKDITEVISENVFNERLEAIMSDELFNEEMLDMVPIYTDYCRDQFNEAQSENASAIMEIEQKLDLREYVPESFGTADCVIINDGLMEVIDLKYGKGVPVQAEWNKQLMLYGLGALRKYDIMYCITEIRLTIVQPRLNNISSWLISVQELRSWAETELRPKAHMAYEGQGELVPGEWCKFCSIKTKCRKLYEQQLEIARYDFSEPALLTDEDISDILKRAPRFIEWINSITEYAQDKAVNENKFWPGFKLVEGRSIRKWADEDKAAQLILSKLPALSANDIFNMKLKTITEMEKLVGKKAFAELLSDAVVKPQGKPTLVPDSDKRPALGISQAQTDFSDNI